MSDTSAKTPNFDHLNTVLGVKTPPAPYKWSGTDVVLKAGKFDEQKYLDAKLQALLERKTALAREQVLRVFGHVITDNDRLVFEMYTCTPEQLQQYDIKFNMILEAAFNQAEHDHNLKLSKENIKNSFQVSDSWMDSIAVIDLMKLTSVNSGTPPDTRKFVPKFRR